jgi:hypothetical protein
MQCLSKARQAAAQGERVRSLCVQFSWARERQTGSDKRQPWRRIGRGEGNFVGVYRKKGNARRGNVFGRPSSEGKDGQDSAHADPQGGIALAAPSRHHRPPPTRDIRTFFHRCVKLLVATTTVFCRRCIPITVTQLDGVPTLPSFLLFPFERRRTGRNGFLGVDRWFDVVGLCPGPAFFRREAAAVRPTLLGRLAAAGMMLTGKRLAADFVDEGGQRNLQSGKQIDEKDAYDRQSASQMAPEAESPESTHGRKLGSRAAVVKHRGIL